LTFRIYQIVADASSSKHEKIHKGHILSKRPSQGKKLYGWIQRHEEAGEREFGLIVAFFTGSGPEARGVHYSENGPAGPRSRPQTDSNNTRMTSALVKSRHFSC
jgi:hypothetical protein